MTRGEYIEDNASAWLAPAMIDQPAEALAPLLEASVSASEVLNDVALGAVLLAFGEIDADGRHWVAEAVRSHDPAFDPSNKDDLLSRVASIAVMRRLATHDDPAALLALAVGSASFIGLKPVVPELPSYASQRLAELGAAVRGRDQEPPPDMAKAHGPLPTLRKPNEETGVIDVARLAADVAAESKGIKALATALQPFLDDTGHRLLALDEEIEILWWVFGSRDSEGTSWSDHSESSRAVRAALELADRTRILPGPPSAGALLARLFTDTRKKVSIADLAADFQSSELQLPPNAPQRLFPVLAAGRMRSELFTESDDETWKRASENKISIDPDTKIGAVEACVQVYRELQMLQLVPE